jgi:hypothetical protein
MLFIAQARLALRVAAPTRFIVRSPLQIAARCSVSATAEGWSQDYNRPEFHEAFVLKLAIAISALVTLTGTCVLAADMAVKAPPPLPALVYSWTGFYVGANIGGGWGSGNVHYTPNDPGGAALVIRPRPVLSIS